MQQATVAIKGIPDRWMTLLEGREEVRALLDQAIEQLAAKGVLIRGDGRTLVLAESLGAVTPASDIDWSTEYLDYILSIKIVDSVTEAIAHINVYGSHHTDTIVAESKSAARAFLRGVDSASVMHNASTRFADGFRYRLGAEVGISTNRIHSRGPVGLDGLVIYKYVLEGDGHIVDGYDGYHGKGPLPFTHRTIDEQCQV